MKPRSRLRKGGRLIIWAVSIVSAVEAFVQAVEGLLDDRVDKFVLWLAGFVVILVGARFIETYKAKQGRMRSS